MALLPSRHCGQPEPHERHRGRQVTHMRSHPVVCDGDPAQLERQRWTEDNPPPGPPDIPRRYEWDAPNTG